MNDVLPDEIGRWQRVEQVYARDDEPARLPRGAHAATSSRRRSSRGPSARRPTSSRRRCTPSQHHDEPLTLRPEGTAGAARAYVEHGVHAKEPVTRWWYAGPMFRAERPQRGRYRQFYQLGRRDLRRPGPGCDAEMIDMLVRFLRELARPGRRGPRELARRPEDAGRATATRSCATSRRSRASLSEDSQRRLETNPLRILDSKNAARPRAVKDAPTLHDFLDAEDRAHFDGCAGTSTRWARRTRSTRGSSAGSTTTRARSSRSKARTRSSAPAARSSAAGATTSWWPTSAGRRCRPSGFAAGLERLLIASELRGAGRTWSTPRGAARRGGDRRRRSSLARDLRRQRHPLRGRHARHVAQEPAPPGQRARRAHGAHPGRRRARRGRRAGEGPRRAHAGDACRATQALRVVVDRLDGGLAQRRLAPAAEPP